MTGCHDQRLRHTATAEWAAAAGSTAAGTAVKMKNVVVQDDTMPMCKVESCCFSKISVFVIFWSALVYDGHPPGEHISFSGDTGHTRLPPRLTSH